MEGGQAGGGVAAQVPNRSYQHYNTTHSSKPRRVVGLPRQSSLEARCCSQVPNVEPKDWGLAWLAV